MPSKLYAYLKLRPQYHMHFILDGSGYFEIDHQIHHLKKGQIFLIPPNTQAWALLCRQPDTVDLRFYQLSRKQVRTVYGMKACLSRYPDHSDPEEYADVIRKMLKTHQLTITNELCRVSLLFSLFSMLTASSHSADSQYPQKHHDYLPETYFEHALQYIHFNYNKNIHIQDIADYIGITRSYLFCILTRNDRCLHKIP